MIPYHEGDRYRRDSSGKTLPDFSPYVVFHPRIFECLDTFRV